jgi:hypothetical protein
MFEIFSSD